MKKIKELLWKFRNWSYKFMYGRNGYDTICRFLFIPILILLVINLFCKGIARTIVFYLALALLIYTYFRMLSKNVSARRKENDWLERKLAYYKRKKADSKTYKYFNCPRCGTHLRVPRGVGKITVTCKKCGEKFDRKA